MLVRSHLKSLLWAVHFNTSLDKLFDQTNDASYYSYWMNDGSLILSVRKISKKALEFVVRVHGYDLYHDRSSSGLVLFQQLNCRMAKNILPISLNGKKYLSDFQPAFASKIHTSYLGVPDRGINPSSTDPATDLVIVSCSFMHALKRIHLIVETLMLLDNKVTWIHLGGGPEMPHIQALCEKLPANITYQLPGDLSNTDIIDFYLQNHVDLFIHMSETEGIPVAIMEATSFGIPVLATDVGGVGELVTEQTGILVSADITPAAVAQEIKRFMSSHMHTADFSISVRNYWNNNFNAEKNYNDFIDTYLQ
ncbi:glycosyltransferase [Chitinophaga nivalis]|uniref:Glycosyltransferase n=1 Tax=Chitinophaga nivalis TaxID=2991709 RepID=A0ABT3IVP8_9BACT|nr:glycosyltransferase [Chitinophaga nivalis]MCW3462338.1 glycosyltransferase [Chitinophaga nivalis]MCW3487971.1 glycosyltransferase [Chitinophaga nivalis]